MRSLWRQTAQIEPFAPLPGDVQTDVLIIGGGMAGLLTAYLLRRSGVQCILAEKNTLFSGVSGSTTAKITVQHGFCYSEIKARFSQETAGKYLQANLSAAEQFAALCREIDCNYERKDSFVYTLTDPLLAEREAKVLHSLGTEADLCEFIPLPVPSVGAVRFPRQAQFHPVKFASAIAKDLEIYEHTFVREIENRTALTPRGKIRAQAIVIASHFPFINTHGLYSLKLYQHRSYVLGLSPAPQIGGMYADADPNGLSFRNYGDLLLLGGGDHRTGRPGGGWQALREFAARYYPSAQVAYRWAAQDCMPTDPLPYIGPYAKNTPGLYVTAGFAKWGMTGSMAAAMLLRDRLTGVENDCADVFSPQRRMVSKQFFMNAAESAAGYLPPAKKRCPHLGGKLIWNPLEKSWDCPCHGSRFAPDGEILENPSQKRLF